MDKAEQLRQQIKDLTAQYYKEAFKEKPFVKGESYINYGGRYFDGKEMTNLVDASLDFWLTAGKWAEKFETQFAKWLNVKYCSLCNSGSSANLLAFFALCSPLLKDRQIKRGDEVITVAAGFPTTVAPIMQYGAVPVFVDITLPQYNMDIALLEQALTPKTKAVMAAHTLGNPFDAQAVNEFCKKHNLWLIEDNCDALGSECKVDGQMQKTGTIGDIGTSSFYPPHHMTMGEGGAVYTDNPLLHKIINSLRDWGRDCWCASGKDDTCRKRFSVRYGLLPEGYDHKYVYSHMGFNLKATDLQASIGVAQLEKLDYIIQRRRENFDILYGGLSQNKNLILPQKLKDSNPSWFGFIITVDKNAKFTRNELTQFLENHKIQTRNLFAGNLIKHPVFQSYVLGRDYRIAGELNVTDRVTEDTFWIGVYPGMSREKLEYMVETINQFGK